MRVSIAKQLSRWLTITASVLCVSALANVSAAGPSCQPRILARCSIDMTLDAARKQFPGARVEIQKNGTRVMTVQASDPIPTLSVAGVLRLTFDEHLLASEIRFRADDVKTEIFNTTTSAWGTYARSTDFDMVDGSASTETHWAESCNVIANMYTTSAGALSRTTATWVLVRFTP